MNTSTLHTGTISALFLFIPTWLSAEGTAQLMPAGAPSNCVSYVQGNDGSGKEGPSYHQPATEYVYVHVADPTREQILFGFTRLLPTSKPVYYQLLDPEGNIVATGRVAETSSDPGFIANDGVEAYVGPSRIAGASGYDAIVYQPLQSGNYAFRFNVNHATTPRPSESKYYLHPFDVAIVDTVDEEIVTGRLFAYRWHLNTNSSSNKACMEFFTWTPDSLVMMMDMNGMQPHGYTVSFNSFGVQQTGDISVDRRSTNSISTSVPEYMVFLQEPDEDVFPSGTPGSVSYLNIDGCQVDSSFCIMVNTTKPGELNIYIDLDGNGVYDEGTRDVYFPYDAPTGGDICVPWDGIDGLGNPSSLYESGTVIVQFLAGIVHYPVYDPENNTAGFRCELVRPATGLLPKMYYDNQNTPIGTVNLSGCDSLCNTWTGGSGDRVMVNTWINTITSEDEEPFVMNITCAPNALPDSTCTRPALPVQVNILENDWDRDNSLDPATVNLFNLSHHPSQFVYNASGHYVTLFPADGDSSEMSFSYVICDNTSLEQGGAMCDTGRVTVSIDPGCATNTVLGWSFPQLVAIQTREGVQLLWHTDPGTLERELRLLRVREDLQAEAVPGFDQEVLAGGVHLDRGPYPTSGRLGYRWSYTDASGQVQTGPVLWLNGWQGESRVLTQHQHHGQLVLRVEAREAGTVTLTDLLGRELMQWELPAGTHQLSLPHSATQASLVARWRSARSSETLRLWPLRTQ